MDAPCGAIRAPRAKRPVEDRLWEKVDRKTDAECWRWLASLNKAGYGQFNIDNKMKRSHRVTYELLRGPIPEGLVLDHLCRNRWCVNPWHMEAITNVENVRRGAHFWDPEKCPRGHEYTDENTASDRHGYRVCLTCRRMLARERYRRNRTGPLRERSTCIHCGRDVAISPHSRQFSWHMAAQGGCLFGCCGISDRCRGALRTAEECGQGSPEIEGE